jgi:outer membrane lipoprotein SlyB
VRTFAWGTAVKQLAIVAVCSLAMMGCTPSYSPNTYASNAVQLANKVDTGTIVGFREVKISANGTIGAVTGGAVGGVLGSEYTSSALLAVTGTAAGAAVGHTIDRAVGDTTGWEYIVRKTNGDLVSVTQREKTPIPLGQHVLVINGPQARVIPDYSVAAKDDATPKDTKDKTASAPEKPVKVEVVLSLPPGVAIDSATGAKVTAIPQAAPPIVTAAPVPVAASGGTVVMTPPVADPIADAAPPAPTQTAERVSAASVVPPVADAPPPVPTQTAEQVSAAPEIKQTVSAEPSQEKGATP